MYERDGNPEPVRSEFAGDPEVGDLVELFATGMEARAADLWRRFEAGELEELPRLARQLRAAATGYGFRSLGEAAAEFEEALRTGEDLEAALTEVEKLIDLCQRTTGGTGED